MLRLAPTRISLTSADLDWHTRRRKERLAKVKNGGQAKAAIYGSGSQIRSPQSPVVRDPMPTRQDKGKEVLIYSDEPIPEDPQASKPFWDKILAEGGTPSRVQAASLALLPQVVSPSESFLESTGSVYLSVEGQDDDDHTINETLDDLLISPRSPDFARQSPESRSSSWSTASTQIQSRRSPVSLPVRLPTGYPDEPCSSDDSNEELELPPVAETGASVKPVRSLEEQGTTAQDPWVNQMDVDGPADAELNLRHYRSTSSLQDPEPGSVGMPFGAQARKAELAAFRNAQAASSVIDLSSHSPGFGAPNRAYQDEQNSFYTSQHLRTRSGGLPRSRLYISEVAASSSPEQRQRSVAEPDNPMPSDNDSSSLAPRRGRKKYKRRSGSPSFAASTPSTGYNHSFESSYASENPFGGSMANLPPQSLPRDINSSFSPPRSGEHHHLASSPSQGSSGHHTAYSSSTYANGMSSHSGTGSSYDLPTNHNLSFDDFSSLPPQTFNAHRLPLSPPSRNLPNNHPLPLDYTATNENAQSLIHNHFSPSTPPNRSSSIGLYPTPTRLSIYNDTIPAFMQPQTPQGLPRNGLPPMSLQNPFHTAPARQGGLGPRRGRIGWEPPTTPTRGAGRMGWGVVEDGRRDVGVIGDGRWTTERADQENVSVEVEAERREQRERVERASRVGGSLRG
ncbi:MAG: hypothetical protein L6R40_003196 [Gallowayella cf. fulva]|nr:MAG: hypothetical protein L6R40_003196 [Xanthomendoza cf. fulva]